MVIVVQAAEQAELTVEMQLQVPAAVVEVGVMVEVKAKGEAGPS